MWIRMRTIAAGPLFSYDVGQVVEVDDGMAKAWIDAGHAEKVAAPAQTAGAARADETASVDDGEKAADVPLINKLRGGNVKPTPSAAKS